MIFVGVISPLILILAYPLFFYIPAEVFLYIGSQNPYEILHVPQWVMIWSLAVLLLMLPVAFIVLLRWIADVNEIGRGRLILSMIVVYLPIMFVHDVYVAPYVSKGLRIFGEILGQLV